MGQAKRELEAHEDRVTEIQRIGLEVGALVQDEQTDEISSNPDDEADKEVYARAFRARADGKLEGTAQEVFDAIEAGLS